MSSSSSVRRQLSFKELPFCGKRFYLDVKGTSTKTRISQRIIELGGQIESFLSKDLFLLITDKDTRECLSKKNTLKDGLVSAQNSNIPLSRGKALLLKAAKNKQADTGNSHDVLQSAINLGVKTQSSTAFIKTTSKLLEKFSLHSRNASVENYRSPVMCIAEKENQYTIKVEDSENFYKPLYKQFDSKPKIADSETGAPFSAGVLLEKPVNENVSKPKTKGGPLRGGYCECCDYWYKCSLSEHLQSSKHLTFVSSQENYEALDKVAAELPNLKGFLMKYGLQERIQECATTEGQTKSNTPKKVILHENLEIAGKESEKLINEDEKANSSEKPGHSSSIVRPVDEPLLNSATFNSDARPDVKKGTPCKQISLDAVLESVLHDNSSESEMEVEEILTSPPVCNPNENVLSIDKQMCNSEGNNSFPVLFGKSLESGSLPRTEETHAENKDKQPGRGFTPVNFSSSCSFGDIGVINALSLLHNTDSSSNTGQLVAKVTTSVEAFSSVKSIVSNESHEQKSPVKVSDLVSLKMAGKEACSDLVRAHHADTHSEFCMSAMGPQADFTTACEREVHDHADSLLGGNTNLFSGEGSNQFENKISESLSNSEHKEKETNIWQYSNITDESSLCGPIGQDDLQNAFSGKTFSDSGHGFNEHRPDTPRLSDLVNQSDEVGCPENEDGNSTLVWVENQTFSPVEDGAEEQNDTKLCDDFRNSNMKCTEEKENTCDIIYKEQSDAESVKPEDHKVNSCDKSKDVEIEPISDGTTDCIKSFSADNLNESSRDISIDKYGTSHACVEESKTVISNEGRTLSVLGKFDNAAPSPSQGKPVSVSNKKQKPKPKRKKCAKSKSVLTEKQNNSNSPFHQNTTIQQCHYPSLSMASGLGYQNASGVNNISNCYPSFSSYIHQPGGFKPFFPGHQQFNQLQFHQQHAQSSSCQRSNSTAIPNLFNERSYWTDSGHGQQSTVYTSYPLDCNMQYNSNEQLFGGLSYGWNSNSQSFCSLLNDDSQVFQLGNYQPPDHNAMQLTHLQPNSNALEANGNFTTISAEDIAEEERDMDRFSECRISVSSVVCTSNSKAKKAGGKMKECQASLDATKLPLYNSCNQPIVNSDVKENTETERVDDSKVSNFGLKPLKDLSTSSTSDKKQKLQSDRNANGIHCSSVENWGVKQTGECKLVFFNRKRKTDESGDTLSANDYTHSGVQEYSNIEPKKKRRRHLVF